MNQTPAIRQRDRIRRAVVLLLWFSLCGVAISGLTSCADDLDSARAEIELMFQTGRADEAMPRLEALIDQYPDDRELNTLYGSVLLAVGSPSSAIWPLRKATESPESGPEDWLLLATAHLEGGSPADAIAILDRLLEETPGIIEAHELRIEANIALNQPEKALEDVEFLLDVLPDNESLVLTRATVLLDLERIDEATEAIAAARAVMSKSEQAEEWKARFCAIDATFIDEERGEGYVERALDAWAACVEAHPAEMLVVTEAIRYFDEKGLFDRGDVILTRAVEEAPEDPGFRIMLSQRLASVGEVTEAERGLREAIELPGGDQGRSILIDLLSEQERYAEALVVLEEWIDKIPNPSMSMRIMRTDLMVRSDKFAEAEVAIAALPQEEFRNIMNGRLALRKGEPQKALELLEKGIALWPGNGVVRVLAAEAAEQLGDFDRAFAEYVEACRSEPSNWEAMARLGAMHVARRRSEPFYQLFGFYIRERQNHVDAYLLLFEVGQASGRQQLTQAAIRGLNKLPAGRAVGVAVSARASAGTNPAEALALIANSRFDLTVPQNAEVLAALVEILGSVGRHDEAIEHADAAVAAQPEFAHFHVIRATALTGSGAAAGEIRAALERAVELDGNLALALMALGRLDATDGKVDAAVALFDRAAVVDRDEPTAQWAAITALLEAGRESEVDPRLEKLVGRHIEHADAIELMARRLEARGDDLEKAQKYSELAAQLKGI